MLYRKTRDGSNAKDFHNKCDNKGNTIIFIETTKGYKFGGYTELQWDCSSQSKTDKSTFLFSFNKKKKFIAKNKNDSIHCYSYHGPVFGYGGGPDIYFPSNLNKGESQKNNNTFLTDRDLTNGEQYWDTKEVEVYKILFI